MLNSGARFSRKMDNIILFAAPLSFQNSFIFVFFPYYQGVGMSKQAEYYNSPPQMRTLQDIEEMANINRVKVMVVFTCVWTTSSLTNFICFLKSLTGCYIIETLRYPGRGWGGRQPEANSQVLEFKLYTSHAPCRSPPQWWWRQSKFWQSKSRHLVSTSLTQALQYSSSVLKAIGKTKPKKQISSELWQMLGDLGIRRKFRSRRRSPNCDWSTSIPESSITTGRLQSASSSLDSTNLPSASASVFRIPSILYSNTCSLMPKMDELQCVVDVNIPGFVSITETWRRAMVPDSAVHLSNYILFRRDRPTPAGGVCIFVNA